MKLQQIIYRDLLVVARALDRSAAFRALISSNLLVRPSVDDQANANNKAVQPHADAFNRDVLSFLQNRSYYLPSSNRPSVEAIVRDRFRSNPSDPKLAIDTAFVALKALNDRLAHAIETGVIDVRDVGPAAFQTKPKPRRMTVSFQRAKLVKERTISQALRDEAIEKPMPLTVRLAESVTTGVFLLAHPLLDGIFNRSVIVLTDHSLVKGTKGFIVNHSTKVPLRKRFNVDKRILSAFGLSKVRKGGPVPTEYAEVLHRRAELGGDRVVSSNFKTTMDDDLYSGINLDAAAKAFEAGTVQRSDVVFMNGMSSWMPGQLDDELQRGAWVAVRAPLSVAVSAKKSLWNEMMARLGGEYEAFSRMPSVSDDDDFDDEEEDDDDDDGAAGGPRGK